MKLKNKALLIAAICLTANFTATTQSAQAITSVTPETVYSSNTGAELSASEVIDWVCKTLITVVAVSAWVYVVVRSAGILLVVSKEVIKYVTVPSIVCEWL
jgi:hypothetical protein